MAYAQSLWFRRVAQFVAWVFLVACLEPTRFGISPDSLPRLRFGPAPASADGDVSAAPYGAVLRVGRSVQLLNADGSEVRVTYSVVSADGKPVSDVRLGVSLVSGATLLTSTPGAERSGQELSFSLGTIAGHNSASAIVTLSRSAGSGPIDTGARVYGSQLGVPVTASTTPAVVNTSAGDPALLAPTVDANANDRFIIAQAGKLDHDPARIFTFVRDSIRYEVYTGSLRGARGTLLHGGGNSIDKSSLLVALLRASGVPARYVQGTITDLQAKLLIGSMFPPQLHIIGLILGGDQTADPLNNGALLAEAKAHTWVEFDSGGGFQAADASFPAAALGAVFGSAGASFNEIPDAQRHKVTLRLNAEITTPSLLGGSFSGLQPVLEATFPSAELSGKLIHLQHFIDGNSAPSPVISYTTFNYSPYFIIDDGEANLDANELVRGTDYQEVATNFPFGSQLLTGVFLDVETAAPGGSVKSFQKTILDRIGYEIRQNGGVPNLPSTPQPAFFAEDITTIAVATGGVPERFDARRGENLKRFQSQLVEIKPQIDALNALNLTSLTPEQQEFANRAQAIMRNGQQQFLSFVVERFQSLSTVTNQATEASSYSRIYPDTPRVIIATQRLKINSNSEATAVTNLDLLKDDARIVLAPGQSTSAEFSARMNRGISENIAEAQALTVPGLPTPGSTANIFAAAKTQGRAPITLTFSSATLLEDLPISAEAKGRISSALQQNKIVIVPDGMVEIEGAPTVGWYEIDGNTGETIGVLEDGSHGATINYVALIANVFLYLLVSGAFYFLGYFGSFFLFAIPGAILVISLAALHIDKGPLDGGLGSAADFIGLGGLNPATPGYYEIVPFLISKLTPLLELGAYLPIAASLAFVYGVANGVENGIRFLQRMINSIDPAVRTQLAYYSPLTDLSRGSTTINVAAGTGGGAVSGAQQTGLAVISGSLSTSWTGPASFAAEISNLNANSAAVTDSTGAPVGSGTVAISGMTTVSLRAAINGTLALNGEGELSFYGPSTALVGASGSWKSFSGNVAGGAVFTVITDRLMLNGALLPAGTYSIAADTAALSGSGAGAAANFVGGVELDVQNGAVQVGAGAGNLSVGGAALNAANGYALSGFDGTISIGASADTDTFTLDGTTDDVALVTLSVQAAATDQNTPVLVEPGVLASVSDEFTLFARAPPGWTVSFTNDKKLEIRPAGGLQSGTFPVFLSAQSTVQPKLLAAAQIDITLGATTPGVAVGIVPDPAFYVTYNGGALRSVFTTEVRNLGPAADTFTVSLTQAPVGFDLELSGSTLTIPPGGVATVGTHLLPNGALPPPGTVVNFEITATSNSNGAIADSALGSFVVPEFHAVAAIFNPPRLSSPPGAAVNTELTVQNFGNVDEPNVELLFEPAPGLEVSAPNSPLSLSVGDSSTQTITFTPDAGMPLNTSSGAALDVMFGSASDRRTLSSGIGVEVEIPGAGAANDAALAAAQAGDPVLSQAIRALGLTISGLFLNPSDPIEQSLAVANLNNLISLLQAEAFSGITEQLEDIRNTILSGDPAEILNALENLTFVLENLTFIAAAVRLHDFRIYLLPSSALAQPNVATPFTVVLQNVGTAPTTIALELGFLPPGVSSTIDNGTQTLAPGEVSSLAIVTLTQSGQNVVPFEFSVFAFVTDGDGAGLSHEVRGSLTSRAESLQLFGPSASPPFVASGDAVATSVKAIAALNAPKNVKLFYELRDSSAALVSTSNAVLEPFDVQSSIHEVALENIDTTGLADGQYTVKFIATEEDDTPIAGAEVETRFLVGSPLDATLTVNPEQLPPGSSSVQATLHVESVGGLGSGLELLGTTPLPTGTSSHAFAIKDDLVYIGNGPNTGIGIGGVIVDISDPTAPAVVGNFAAGIPVLSLAIGGAGGDKLVVGAQAPGSGNNGNSVVRVFNLANPLSPALESPTPLTLTNRQFFGDVLTRGDRVYSIHVGFRFFLSGNDIFNHWGGVSIADISNPAAPSFTGEFYTTSFPDNINPAITIDGYGAGFSASIVDVSPNVVYQLSTTGSQNNIGDGQGAVRVFNVSNPASPVLDHTLTVPNTGHVWSGVREGNEVLLVGSTGSINDPGATGVGGTNPFFVRGNLVLTVLDVSDPLNPAVTKQESYPDVAMNFITRVASIGGGKWFIGERLTRAVPDSQRAQAQFGAPLFGIVDTNAPGAISLATYPAFPGADGYQFAIHDGNLVIAAPPPAGLLIYSLDNQAAAAVSASVDVPKGFPLSVVPNSFNIPPSSIIDNGAFDTLVWDSTKFPSPYAPFEQTITWELEVNEMKAVEAREALKGGKVDFVFEGAPGKIDLSPAFVSSGLVLSLDPETQAAAPGGSATYEVTINNTIGFEQIYEMRVLGVDPDWVSIPFLVTVPAASSTTVPLTISPAPDAALADYAFTVLAIPGGGETQFAGSVRGTLVVEGEAVKPDGISHGVAVQLTPQAATAGQAVPARFRVRLTNTGLKTDTFLLTANAPGFDATFSEPSVAVLPGRLNFREVELSLLPQAGNTGGADPFTVTATLDTDASVQGSANGTVNVLSQGVVVMLLPDEAAPGGQMILRVINTGTATDTFTLSLSGPAAPFATLAQSAVTLATGANTDVPISIGAVPTAVPGKIDLIAAAASQANAAASALARGKVVIGESSGLGAAFLPPETTIPVPGEALLYLSVNNLGNVEDAYRAEITGTTSDLSAVLVDLNGNPARQVPLFRLPGQSTGGFLVRTNKPSFGEGTVNVTVSSIAGAAPDAVASALVRVAQDLCPNDPQKFAPGVCGCGTADVDLDQNGIIDCIQPGPVCIGACNGANPNLDEDRDSVSNCTELADRTDPCDSGSFVQKLLPTSCAGANGYLKQINIATVINKLSTPLDFLVVYRDAGGTTRGQVGFTLNPSLKRDLIINDLGLLPDSYGTVCVFAGTTASDAWSGGLTMYKSHLAAGSVPTLTAGENFDFALYYPFENPQKSSAALSLNTNSLGTDGRGLVANWVRVTDAVPGDGKPLSGTIRYHGIDGSLAAVDRASVADGGRFDFAGHERIGVNAVGLAEFIPDDPLDQFYFEESRYFYEGVGAASENFYTAFTLPRRPLTGAALTGRTPVRANEISVIEIVNGSANAAQAEVRLFGNGGAVLGTESYAVPPKGSVHRIVLGSGNGANDIQTAEVSGPAESLAATTLTYVFDSAALLYGYAQPFAESAGIVQFTEFNSFIGHKNTLDLSNATDKSINLAVQVLNFDNSTVFTTNTSILPRANLLLPLGVPLDSYGTIIVDSGGEVGVVVQNRVERPNQYLLNFVGR